MAENLCVHFSMEHRCCQIFRGKSCTSLARGVFFLYTGKNEIIKLTVMILSSCKDTITGTLWKYHRKMLKSDINMKEMRYITSCGLQMVGKITRLLIHLKERSWNAGGIISWFVLTHRLSGILRVRTVAGSI